MSVSGNVHVDNTDIGCSDHFLVWMESAKAFKKEKRVIRRRRLERFDEDEVKLRYQNALKVEVHGISESVKSKLEGGMRGYDLVNEVLMEWENIVNRVAKSEVGENMIVCGRAARWWDNEQISLSRELYKKVINGREDLWDEYYRLRKEVKELVREKKLIIWREVVEKANTDFDGSKKEFWAFVGRRTRKKNIPSLKSEAGVSVTSTRGKLEVLQRHYSGTSE